jgi:hypothetical protein
MCVALHLRGCAAHACEPQNAFRNKQQEKAVIIYTQAANTAMSRAPWEPAQLAREEVATVMSNRSAAFYEAGDYVAALLDAEVVIALKKGWSKGFFRKAKALVGLDAPEDARQAILDGLAFEPENKVRVRVHVCCVCVTWRALRRISSGRCKTSSAYWLASKRRSAPR